MKKLSFIILGLILISTVLVKAQTLTLKGRIVDEELRDLPEVKITNQNNELLGITDINGQFEISVTNQISRLNISFPGMEPTIIEPMTNCNFLEVVVMFETHYDFMSLKKVDKLRMKRFKKLKDLHKEAFLKGIFRTDKPCYTRLFIPYYKKNKSKK